MYQLSYPDIIRFGDGCRHDLPEVLTAIGQPRARYVLVTGSSAYGAAVVEELGGLLGPAAAVFREVRPEPTLANVEVLRRLLRETAPEVVIAVGGGSVLDAAKAAAVLAPLPESVADHFYGRATISRPGLPLIAVPTTSGTGTEVTRNAVIVDPRTRVKQSIRHDVMIPTAALVDPELTAGCPRQVVIASGLDAFTQALESYVSRRANPVTRALAEQALALLLPALPRWVENPADAAARADTAEGSLIGGLAFAHSGLGAVHGLAHPIGSLLGLAHGYVCAVLLPHVLAFNLPAVREDLNALAGRRGWGDAVGLLGRVRQLVAGLGVPGDFRAAGLCAAHLPFILAKCRSGSMRSNPRELADEDIRALLVALGAE